MKTIWIIMAAGIMVCGIGGLTAWSDDPPDEVQIKQQKADAIMRQTYGDNWQKILAVYESSTNLVEAEAMAKVYEAAIGYHRPGDRK